MIYRLLHKTVLWMSMIPWPVGQFLGRMLGTTVAFVPMFRRKVVHDNIKNSSEGLQTETGIKKMTRNVFVHFGEMLFEVPHVFKLTSATLEKYAVFENEENFLAAMEKGRGVFVLTAHFGNWELMSAALSIRFAPGAVIVRNIDFQPLNRLINEMRNRFGTEVIHKQRAMRKTIGAVKEKKAIGILLDQNVDWYEGVFVKFLGRWACTNKGLALLALRTGAPVVPVFSVKQRDGRYRIVFEKEVELVRTKNKANDVEENTALFSRAIEKYVKAYPDHWFWFHRRWKTRPYCPFPKNEGSSGNQRI